MNETARDKVRAGMDDAINHMMKDIEYLLWVEDHREIDFNLSIKRISPCEVGITCIADDGFTELFHTTQTI